MKSVALKNKIGKIVEVKIGYSWTSFFFSFIPSILRGHWKFGFCYLLVLILANIITTLIGFRIDWLIPLLITLKWGSIRNQYLLSHYLNNGWKIISMNEVSDVDINKYMGYKLESGCYLLPE